MTLPPGPSPRDPPPLTLPVYTQSLRAQGILFVIITGARKSTLLERLPFLPKGDAAVSETGPTP